MKISVTTLIGVAGLAASLTLGACATSATDGDYTVFGVDTHINAATVSTDVGLVKADVQAAVNALPNLCQDFSQAAAMTQAEIGVLAQVTKLPAKTVANISNASAKGNLACAGTVAVVAPAAIAPAGTPPTASP